MKKIILFAIAVSCVAVAALAGGLAGPEIDPEIIEPVKKNSWLVPAIGLLAIGLIIASSDNGS